MSRGIGGLSSLGTMGRIALGTFIATCVLTILFQLFSLFASEMAIRFQELLGILSLGIGGIQILAFFACVVVIAIWIFRAHANLHEAGLTGLNYRPGWAAASFFVPFVNVYVPFASTRELHNRSHGESDWHAKSEVGDVTSWAACNWGALAVFSASVTYLSINSIPGVHVLLPMWGWLGLSVLLYIMLAGSAWFLFKIISKVTLAQENGLHLSQASVFD